jgi:Family of unknown function (DUF5706)
VTSRPAGNADTAAEFLDVAATDGDTLAAVQGIGYALLAVVDQLAGANEGATETRDQLFEIAKAIDGPAREFRGSRVLGAFGRLARRTRPGHARKPGIAGAAAFSATQTGHGPVAARAVLAAAGVVFAAAVLVLLAALRPRFGTAGWCRYLSLTAEDISDLDRNGRTGTCPATRACDLTAEDLGVFSRMAHAKYRRVRLAVDLIGAGVFLLGAGVVAGVIA